MTGGLGEPNWFVLSGGADVNSFVVSEGAFAVPGDNGVPFEGV